MLRHVAFSILLSNLMCLVCVLKNWMKIIRRIAIVLLIFVVLFSPFILSHMIVQIERDIIHDEVFSYVLENRYTIQLSDSKRREFFVYDVWSFIDAGIVYGYFYSPYNEYLKPMKAYRTGYLKYATPYFGIDWCYIKKSAWLIF